MKLSGLQGSWSALALYIGGLLVILPGFEAQGELTCKSVTLGLVAGVFGGVGAILFTRITNSTDKNAPVSNLYARCLIVELLVAVIAGCLMCGEEITNKKIVGAVMASVAILLLA